MKCPGIFQIKKNVFQISKISVDVWDYYHKIWSNKFALKRSVCLALGLINCGPLRISETSLFKLFWNCDSFFHFFFFFPFREPLHQASKRQFIQNHSSVSQFYLVLCWIKWQLTNPNPVFRSGFSVHSSNETSAFSLMPKVIWQTEFEKRTFLLLLCKAHMLHKYYLASPWCILCALCFIIIAMAISIKMLFSSLFFPMLWLWNFILIHSSRTLQTNKMLHRIL